MHFHRRALALVVPLVALTGCVSLTPYAEVRSELPPGSLVEVGGYSVYVEDRQPTNPGEDAEAVVFVHGFGASSYSWRRVVPLLPEYRTLALDLRGFGYSERPPGIAPYTRESQVELIKGVLDRLGIERAHLVGHSYGGALSITFAVTHPERLLSLTLVDPAHPTYPRQRRTPAASFRPLASLYVRTLALRKKPVRKALERSIADDSLVTPELIEAYRQRVSIEGAPRAFYALTTPLSGTAESVELRAIATPTLVVWGEEDVLITPEAGRAATAEIPCHRFVLLEDVGHLPMEEAPGELAAALSEFLAEPEAVCGAGGRLTPP